MVHVDFSLYIPKSFEKRSQEFGEKYELNMGSLPLSIYVAANF
jgi:hypothetical protein